MYNNNSSWAELRLVADPERSQRADVVECRAALFQGKREQNIAPIWVTLQAWKYQGKVLEELKKNDVLIVGGYWKQDSWEKEGQAQTKMVFNCDTLAKKLWANNQQAQGNGGNGSYQQPPQQGYQQQQQPQQNGWQQQGQPQQGYQAPSQDSIPF